jgi:hypothetical protein
VFCLSVSQALPPQAKLPSVPFGKKEKVKPQTQSWHAPYLDDKIGHDAALDDSWPLQYLVCLDHAQLLAATSRRLGRTTNHKLVDQAYFKTSYCILALGGQETNYCGGASRREKTSSESAPRLHWRGEHAHGIESWCCQDGLC